MEDHIKLQSLSFSRGPISVLSEINIAVKRGKITVIMGPSGTGKTTLLRLIGGQLVPDEGCVLVNGAVVHTLPQKKLYALRQTMGMLFQSGGLFTHMNVFDNLAFPLRKHTRLPEPLLRDHILLKLEAVGLRGAAHLMPAELSGGMSRRVALARAIVMDPSLVMYDEPFAGQDPISMGVLMRLIKRLNELLGITSVLVSHDVAEASSIADYIYVIAGGRIIGEGTPKEIMSSQTPAIKQFIQGLPDGTVRFHYPARPIQEDILEK